MASFTALIFSGAKPKLLFCSLVRSYIETADNTYFFATNIGADSGATGSNATEITMSILSDMNIWK